jgi:hypothetical protein
VPVYKNVFDCSADSCWPYYLRSLAVSTAIFLFVPSFGLSLLPPDEPAPARTPRENPQKLHSFLTTTRHDTT